MRPNFTLAAIFGDHMIFQAGKPVFLFGTCQKRKELRILFYGKALRFKTTGTTFCFELPALPFVKDPFDFQVVSGAQAVTIHNCLAGDVYLASGQMNMGMTLRETFETRVKENANIRFFEVPKLPYANANLEFPAYFSNHPSWDTCHHESAMKFSALGYLVAQALQAELDIPIGIISCNLPDASVFSWTSMDEIAQTDSLQKYLQLYKIEMAKYKTLDDYSEVFNAQLPKQMDFQKEIRLGGRGGMPAGKAYANALKKFPDATLPLGPKHHNRPAGAYETMLRTILPFGVKGVLFYQGESDGPNGLMYEDCFKALIRSWRKAFQDPGLPFVFVQIAGYAGPGQPETALAIVREAQAKCISFAGNVFMVSAADLGEENAQLPKDKTILAKRLSDVILEKIYRRGKNAMSPSFFSYSLSEGQLVIYTEFNNLNLVSHSARNLGFRISIDGTAFTDAERVVLMNNQIILRDAKNVQEVRYAFANFPHCDIYSSNDLPLLPFRIRLGR